MIVRVLLLASKMPKKDAKREDTANENNLDDGTCSQPDHRRGSRARSRRAR